jgi:hypothetical protein
MRPSVFQLCAEVLGHALRFGHKNPGWRVHACAAGQEGNLGRCETPPDLGNQIAFCDWLCAVVLVEAVHC